MGKVNATFERAMRHLSDEMVIFGLPYISMTVILLHCPAAS